MAAPYLSPSTLLHHNRLHYTGSITGCQPVEFSGRTSNSLLDSDGWVSFSGKLLEVQLLLEVELLRASLPLGKLNNPLFILLGFIHIVPKYGKAGGGRSQ